MGGLDDNIIFLCIRLNRLDIVVLESVSKKKLPICIVQLLLQKFYNTCVSVSVITFIPFLMQSHSFYGANGCEQVRTTHVS
jgi:hypothetical protein